MTTRNQVITISSDEEEHGGGWTADELDRFELFTAVMNGQMIRASSVVQNE